jgi:hypothetical protein
MIRDHIAANLGIEPDDFEYAPFAQEGGLGKVYQLFGDVAGTPPAGYTSPSRPSQSALRYAS